MTNGQLSVVTVVPTAQLAAAPAVSTDATQQSEGTFAGLLSGIQAQGKVEVADDSSRTEASLIKNNREQSGREAATEVPSVDLMALIQGMQHAAPPLSEPAVQKPEESGKAAVVTEPVSVSSTPAPVASQIALAAFPRSGRMPEVNILTEQGVDMLQNVASVSEQSSVVPDMPDAKTVAGAALRRPVSAPSAATAAATTAGGQAAVAVVTDSQAATAANVVEKQPVNTPKNSAEVPQLQISNTVESLPDGHLTKATGEREQSDRMSIVNTLTTASAGDQHKESAATGMQAQLSPVSDKAPVVTANVGPVQETSVQPTVILPEQKATVAVADSKVAQYGTSDAVVPAKPSDKKEPVSGMAQAQAAAVRQVVPTPVPAVTDVEVQLSQPQPITARAAVVPVTTGSRSTALVQEAYGARQRTNPEQQQGVVKEMASSQHGIALPEELALSSEQSGNEDSDQKRSDVASDNLMPVQDMRGQVKAEHQKVASFSTRPVSAEPVRENISEQVMQQVKDRLVQHDVKPGSQQITLTLSPDNLGELKMNLNLQGSKLSVEIVTENKVVRDSIAQHADTLKDSLSRQNITMESFDVTTGGKGSGSQGQNQNAWRELAKQQQLQFWGPARGYSVAQADLPAGNVAYMKQQGQSMLDIHY